MITDFQTFGAAHLAALLGSVLIGIGFIVWGSRAPSKRQDRIVRYTLAAVIVCIRGARYVMDVYFGVFAWPDLFSLHICHIDLILLSICLIRPNRALFSFCFLIGIPAALGTALFPGSVHPAPGLPRAVLFIMSHAMLIMGALFLALTRNLRPTLKNYGVIALTGNLCLIPVYLVNRLAGTNYLYINAPPAGTVIESLNGLVGWPGYVFFLDALALLLMLAMLGLGQLFALFFRTRQRKHTRAALAVSSQ